MPGREPFFDRCGFETLDGKGDDTALRDAPVMDDIARQRAELCAQLVGQVSDAPPDAIESPLHGVIDGDAQPDLARVVRLPVLEAPRVCPYCVAVGRRPGRAAAVRGAATPRVARKESQCRVARAGICARWPRAYRSRSSVHLWGFAPPIGRHRRGREYRPRARPCQLPRWD